MRLGGVRTREDPAQPRETRPHSQRTERDSEKGEGDLWIQMDWRRKLVVRVGWRLTDRGLGRKEGREFDISKIYILDLEK